MPTAPEREDQRLEILKSLYPWYKEEVFRRREFMMRLTGFAATVLVFLLVTLLIVPVRQRPDSATALFALTGVALFTTIFIFLILQQQSRHRMAKQVLIEIERALGLYETGLYTADTALYPEGWQTAWQADRSVTIYATVLAALTALVIGAILVRL
jgi:hypothetical protein